MTLTADAIQQRTSVTIEPQPGIIAQSSTTDSGGSGLSKISKISLGSATASIDFTAIPSTFTHLRVVFYLRGDTALGTIGIRLQVNGDTASNYDIGVIRQNGTTITGIESFAAASGYLGECPASTATANTFGVGELQIPFYSGSNNKSIFGTSHAKQGTAASNTWTHTFGTDWRSGVVISRVTLFPAAGNFVSGSTATLYGAT